MAKSKKLQDRQERFCREYVIDLNGLRAVLRAGYKMTDKAAGTEAVRLMRKPEVKARIQELMDARAEKVEVKSEEILKELTRIGYSDLRKLFNEDGTVKKPQEWPDDLAAAIAAIDVKEEAHLVAGGFICALCQTHQMIQFTGYIKKIKLWPKDRGLELMGRHKKLFTDKVEHSGKVTLEDILAEARKEDGDG